MADRSGIEWTEATWNPIAGCSIVSPGCTNCYAMRRVAPRLAANPATPHYAGTVMPSKAGPVWTGRIGVAPDRVFTAPLRWRAPRSIFVNSMSDLFHEDVPDAVIDRVFAVMALSPQHTFQVLTKRSKRMRAYLSDPATTDRVKRALEAIVTATSGFDAAAGGLAAHIHWPLPNVWLGVSTEDQTRADERIPDLLATTATIRFVSAEPLLGPIDFGRWLARGDAGLRAVDPPAAGLLGMVEDDGHAWVRPALDWIIVGGESGSGARPMHPAWARSIRNQSDAAGVPFFMKQWGEHLGGDGEDSGDAIWFEAASEKRDSRWLKATDDFDWFDPSLAPYGPMHLRLGKQRAGRLLDGVEHNGFPQIREVPFQ